MFINKTLSTETSYQQDLISIDKARTKGNTNDETVIYMDVGAMRD
jgi:hypothetical protein